MTVMRRRAVAVGLAATVLQGVMLIAFAWPASNLEPRDVPVAVAGPQAAAVAAHLSRRHPDAFEIVTVADAAGARQVIADRGVYGAIVTGAPSGEGGPHVLIASAASPSVAQQLTRIAQQLSGASAASVEDVVGTDPDDPNGGGFAAMTLPLVVSSLAVGYLLALVVPSMRARLVGLATYAVAAGLSSTAIVAGWLSLLPGPYFVLAAVIGLISFAVSATIVAFGAVAGRVGLGIAGLTFLLLGNPLSAASTGPEMLPRPWGALGQLLPPGAGASLLRSAAFFDSAGAAGPIAILLAWAVTASTVLALGTFRTRRFASTPATEPVSAA